MKKDRIIGAAAALLGIVVVVSSLDLEPTFVSNEVGPKVFPIFSASFLILFGTLLAVTARGEEEKTPYMTRAQIRDLGCMAALYVGYAVGLYLVGYVPATFLGIILFSKLMSRGEAVPLWKTALYSAGVTGGIYLVFHVLMSMILPDGILF